MIVNRLLGRETEARGAAQARSPVPGDERLRFLHPGKMLGDLSFLVRDRHFSPGVYIRVDL